MAQNQNFHPEAPAFARSRPDAYYAWLTSNGFPHRVAYDQTTAIFGAPKTPEEQQKEAAAAAQRGQFAQAGGVVGGALLAGEAIREFPNLGGLVGLGEAGATTATTAATGAGATGTGIAGTAGTAATTTGAGAGAVTGTGAATTTGAGATTGATAGMGAGTIAGLAALGAVGLNQLWEGGMKDIVRGRGTRADYINTGLLVGTGGLGGLPNLALRMMGKRSIGAMMTSGKSAPQQLRDDFRGDLKEAGVVDENYKVKLADGSAFNLGLDGKTKYQNVGENIDGKKTRNAWDVDFSNPLAKYATDQIEPMIRNIYGADDPKKKYFPGQYTGMLVNAVTSNAKSEQDVMANIQSVLGQSKFAQQAGVGIQPPPPPKALPGKVARVSAGMYVNDRGEVKPAKSVKQALQINYNKTKEKEKK